MNVTVEGRSGRLSRVLFVLTALLALLLCGCPNTGSTGDLAAVNDGSPLLALHIADRGDPAEHPGFPAPLELPDDVLTAEFDGPIRIREGGVYSGHWASDDPAVPAVLILTSEPVVIENSIVTGPGHLIATEFHRTARLTVRNTYGFGQNPGVYGKAPGRFLQVETFADLVVENNYLEGTAGIYVHRWVGGGSAKIRYNQARNITGMWSDGQGSWLSDAGEYSIVQFVQFNDVHDIVDAEIAWNEVINVDGHSRVEDVISLFDSSGTADSPIQVHDNFIWGAYPTKPAEHRYAGGGIMLGDGDGRFQTAFNNQVVSSANYGIAISGGRDIRVDANRVISAGVLADGTRLDHANVGIYIWNFRGRSSFQNNSGARNVVGYVKVSPDGRASRNDWWIPDASQWEGNTRADGQVTVDMEQSEYERWLEKIRQASIRIGVQN